MIVDVATMPFQLLPEDIDLSLIPTGAGAGAMLAALLGAFARLEPDRLARVILLGNLVGGMGTTFVLLAGILGVFS